MRSKLIQNVVVLINVINYIKSIDIHYVGLVIEKKWYRYKRTSAGFNKRAVFSVYFMEILGSYIYYLLNKFYF